MTFRLLIFAIFTVVGLSGVASAEKATGSNPGSQVAKANSDLVKAAGQYKASVQALIPNYEESLKAATEALEKRKELFEKGLVSKHDIETAEQALRDAQTQLDHAKSQLTESDQLIAEANAEPVKPSGSAAIGQSPRHPKWKAFSRQSLEGRYQSAPSANRKRIIV